MNLRSHLKWGNLCHVALYRVLHALNYLVFLLIPLVHLFGLLLLVHFLRKWVTLAVRWVYFHVLLHNLIGRSAHCDEWFESLMALVEDWVGVNVNENHFFGFLLDAFFLDSCWCIGFQDLVKIWAGFFDARDHGERVFENEGGYFRLVHVEQDRKWVRKWGKDVD